MNAIKVPWITKEGYFDPGKFPIDNVLQQAVGQDESQFRSALLTLQSMYGHGRKEAGVFLLGLLVNCEDNWGKRIAIVEALESVQTQACADLLFRELKRVKCSNTTRRYLTRILTVLVSMPSELVFSGFRLLFSDKSFSPKLRQKFTAMLHERRMDDDSVF
jgi:hypothetical protein